MTILKKAISPFIFIFGLISMGVAESSENTSVIGMSITKINLKTSLIKGQNNLFGKNLYLITDHPENKSNQAIVLAESKIMRKDVLSLSLPSHVPEVYLHAPSAEYILNGIAESCEYMFDTVKPETKILLQTGFVVGKSTSDGHFTEISLPERKNSLVNLAFYLTYVDKSTHIKYYSHCKTSGPQVYLTVDLTLSAGWNQIFFMTNGSADDLSIHIKEIKSSSNTLDLDATAKPSKVTKLIKIK